MVGVLILMVMEVVPQVMSMAHYTKNVNHGHLMETVYGVQIVEAMDQFILQRRKLILIHGIEDGFGQDIELILIIQIMIMIVTMIISML